MNNNFDPGFDREKAAFIALANKGEGLTPIDYLYAIESGFDSSVVSYLKSGRTEVDWLEANNANIMNLTNDTLTANTSIAAGISIQFGNIKFTDRSSTGASYNWPSPPLLLIPDYIYYLSSDLSGNLSWLSQMIVTEVSVPYYITYLTSDLFGNLSWQHKLIPQSPILPDPVITVTIGPYLTSDTTGQLSWNTTTITILALPVVSNQSKNISGFSQGDEILIEGKKQIIPPIPKFEQSGILDKTCK